MEDIINKGRGPLRVLPSTEIAEDQNLFLAYNDEIIDVEIAYSDVTRQWYWNDCAFPSDMLETQHRKIDLRSLPVSAAKVVFMVNLYHVSAFDLAVVFSEHTGLGVMTVTRADACHGNVYRSDSRSFDALRLALYIQDGDSCSTVHYLCAESQDHRWTVSSVRHGDYTKDDDFIVRRDELGGASFSSEEEAVAALKGSAEPVDLSDRTAYTRVSVG